ncbi:uncharacterized protein LOC125493414 isoform X2 [Beta vulgaris subsp. vulgaris]|nr:uncharacterized protein LOC125493414 isoform X2 [Beta vulgaris subsp. vulgaris]XP_057248022.1 uncharacterized protein LOC125493414 isoform X2 [Beta vulgaris subsp. vulgaris]
MPLQLHPQIGSSLTHMHAPQPPLFQLGQLRYPSPISQGILPLGPFGQPVQDPSHSSVKSHHVQLPHQLNAHQDTESKEANLVATSGSTSNIDHKKAELGPQAPCLGNPRNVIRNLKPSLANRASESRGGPSSYHSTANVRDSSGPSAPGQFSGSRGRSFPSQLEIMALDRPLRQTGHLIHILLHSRGSHAVVHRDTSFGYARLLMEINLLTCLLLVYLGWTSVLDTSQRAEGSLKRNISSEDDVDAPLQSGIVRVFKQPGIEAPSDEDDFIEVRSKRQMLNDRREQREKENKAK